ncbi:hypothetical protein I3843_16G067800 [Carya illinoinensis]|nr:hypothetical protein I3843_16G067800 [Carya illinoinensis]
MAYVFEEEESSRKEKKLFWGLNRSLFPNPLLAETYAALHATILGIELGFKRIVLEGMLFLLTRLLKAQKQLWTVKAWSFVMLKKCFLSMIARLLNIRSCATSGNIWAPDMPTLGSILRAAFEI